MNKSITTNTNIVNIFNYNNLQINDFDKIKKNYEKHKLSIIDNFLDKESLQYLNNNINLIFNNKYLNKLKKINFKKFKLIKKERKINNILNYIDIDKDNKNKIKNIFKIIDNNVENMIKKIFNSEILDIKKTYRFTLTKNENLHFDIFDPPNEDTNIVRVFINLDDDYRIWNNSYNIFEFINKFQNKIIKNMINNNINVSYKDDNTKINEFIVNNVMFSNKINDINHFYNKKKFPKIENKFSSGSIWICDSIVNSHQIIYGKKCISYKFTIKTKNNKYNYYKKIISYINKLNMIKDYNNIFPNKYKLKNNLYINIKDYWNNDEINDIIKNYPSKKTFEIIDNENKNENRKNIRTKDIINPIYNFSKSLVNFVNFHTQKEYFHYLIDIFNLDISLKKKTFGIHDINKDAEIVAKINICINYPNFESVRGIHLDKQNSILFGLLYLRKDNDYSEGSNLDIFKFKNNQIKNEYIHKSNNNIKNFNKIMLNKLEHDDLIKIDCIKYQKNNIIWIKNSWDAIHSVTPRINAIEDRIFINIVYMYNK